MALIRTDPFSQAPIYIKLLFNDTELATGTGFLYKFRDKSFLVSNWHNYSGRNRETKQPLSAHGGLPNSVACYLFKKADFIQRTWIVFPLAKDNEFYWLEHPNRDLEIDIGILPIMMPPDTRPIHINDLPMTEIAPEVSHDVFILGYPFPPASIHGLPIWKRGSIASEPGGSSNFFYVDTASRPGMSGAPVLTRYRGFYKTDPTSQAMNDNDWFGEGTDFIGIYSGRIGAEDALQLGRVWKKRLIEEIIESFTKYVEP